MSKLNLIGKKFGKLNIISENETRINRAVYWNCKCECGNQKAIRGSDIVSGKIKSCGCNLNLTGEKFGKLLVINLASNTDKKCHDRYWWCQCDCGSNIKKIRQSHLRKGKIKSCGCDQFPLRNKSPYWKGYGEMSGTFFNTIEHGAKIRKLEFNITKEYIWNLFLKQDKKCALTNIDIKFASDWKTSDGTASLDRIDNSKGYIPGNVWWVHKDINQMKMDFTLDKFFNYCNLIINHKTKWQANQGCP